jgi:hypothetical protein
VRNRIDILGGGGRRGRNLSSDITNAPAEGDRTGRQPHRAGARRLVSERPLRFRRGLGSSSRVAPLPKGRREIHFSLTLFYFAHPIAITIVIVVDAELEECPFVNLPERGKGRSGEGLTAGGYEPLPVAQAYPRCIDRVFGMDA